MPSWSAAEEQEEQLMVPPTPGDATLAAAARRLLERLLAELGATIDASRRSKLTAAVRSER